MVRCLCNRTRDRIAVRRRAAHRCAPSNAQRAPRVFARSGQRLALGKCRDRGRVRGGILGSCIMAFRGWQAPRAGTLLPYLRPLEPSRNESGRFHEIVPFAFAPSPAADASDRCSARGRQHEAPTHPHRLPTALSPGPDMLTAEEYPAVGIFRTCQ